MQDSPLRPYLGRVELAEEVSFEIRKMYKRPDMKVIICWPNVRYYNAIILLEGSPSFESLCCVEIRMCQEIEIAEADFIVVNCRYLPSTMVFWYKTGHCVERVGQWLSVSSLAMSCLKYPRAALALAVGGCACWGICNRKWNAAITAKYELEPYSMNERLHPFLKDKAVLRKKNKEKRNVFNMSTVLTACATAVAAGVFLWARQKI